MFSVVSPRRTNNNIVTLSAVVLLDGQVARDDHGRHPRTRGGDQEAAGRGAGARRDQGHRRPREVDEGKNIWWFREKIFSTHRDKQEVTRFLDLIYGHILQVSGIMDS